MKDAIYDRISIRTYEKKALSEDVQKLIKKLIEKNEQKKGPFGHQIRYFVDHQNQAIDEEAKRIGTYGFIKHAPNFIGGIINHVPHATVDFGYLFEALVLDLTKEGLGTCWLAGTFHRSAFQELIKEGEIIPAITPVGYPEDHLSLREHAIRFAIKADRRKPFDQMFFLGDINHPLNEDPTYEFYEPLHFVKLAPSASNKQPWRIIMDKNMAHFFLEKTPNYNTNRPFVIQELDIGIAIYHFEMGLIELGKSYEIKEVSCTHPNGFDYIISFIIKTAN